jgi:hypothetical protein
MMDIKKIKKQVTLEIPEFKVTLKIKVNGRSSMGNHAGFYAKVSDGTDENQYHVNVLNWEDAMFRGIQRFMKEFHGVGYKTTILPFHANNWVHDWVVIVLDAETGKFTLRGSDKFWLEDTTSVSDENDGLTVKHIRGEGWSPDWEKDDVWTVMHHNTTREHTDPVIAAAQMIMLTV